MAGDDAVYAFDPAQSVGSGIGEDDSAVLVIGADMRQEDVEFGAVLQLFGYLRGHRDGVGKIQVFDDFGQGCGLGLLSAEPDERDAYWGAVAQSVVFDGVGGGPVGAEPCGFDSGWIWCWGRCRSIGGCRLGRGVRHGLGRGI